MANKISLSRIRHTETISPQKTRKKVFVLENESALHSVHPVLMYACRCHPQAHSPSSDAAFHYGTTEYYSSYNPRMSCCCRSPSPFVAGTFAPPLFVVSHFSPTHTHTSMSPLFSQRQNPDALSSANVTQYNTISFYANARALRKCQN